MSTLDRIAAVKGLLDTVGSQLIALADTNDDPDIGPYLKAELLDVPTNELRMLIESGRTLRTWRERAQGSERW